MFPALSGLSSWAALAMAATVVGCLVAGRRLRRRGVAAATALELVVVAVVAGWLGAKLGHTLLEAAGHRRADGTIIDGPLALLAEDPLHWARLLEPGFVFFAGLLGGASALGLWLTRNGMRGRVGDVLDAVAPGVLVGAAIGRVGCLLGGCCYGVPTEVAWAIHFPTSHPTGGVGVHPTELYDAGAALLGAVVAWRSTSAQRLPAGIGGLLGLLPVAVVRLVSESVRGDPGRGGLGPLSTSQWISVIVLVSIVGGVAWRSSHHARRGSRS